MRRVAGAAEVSGPDRIRGRLQGALCSSESSAEVERLSDGAGDGDVVHRLSTAGALHVMCGVLGVGIVQSASLLKPERGRIEEGA